MLVNKRDLIFNELTEKIYGEFTPTNTDDWKLLQLINQYGITEKPIVTKDLLIISGNKRVRAALRIEHITDIEVDVKEIDDDEVDEMMIINHQHRSFKDEITIAWEYHKMTKYIASKEKKNLIDNSDYSLSTIKRVLQAKKDYKKFTKCSEEEAWEYLRKKRRIERKEVNTILQEIGEIERRLKIEDALAEMVKESKIELNETNNKQTKNKNKGKGKEEKYKFKSKEKGFIIYCRSNKDLKDIVENESIDSVISSPPYYRMREYVEDYEVEDGKTQDGQEKTPEEYLENLILSYKEAIRTLKKTGSIWVNIIDPKIDGELLNLPHRFVELMRNEGLSYIQTSIWIKNNPIYNSNKAFQQSFEYIFHFVKDKKEYKWRDNWFGSEDEFLGHITYGGKDKQRKIRNFYFYPRPKDEDGEEVTQGIFETNVFNSSDLKNILDKKDLELRHHAMFPISVPLILALSTTDVGDKVMDNYSGAQAATGLISYALGCDYVGIEISKEYATQSMINFDDFLEKNKFLKKKKLR